MSIIFNNRLIEALMEYVYSINDPMLSFLHSLERRLIDENIPNLEYKLEDTLIINRLSETVQHMIEDDLTVPNQLSEILDLLVDDSK